jgi:hypothetical protein
MRRRLLIVVLALGTWFPHGPTAARAPSVIDLLDRYAAGQFDAVVQTLAGEINFDDLLRQLRRDGPGWIAAGGAGDRARRELAAATFALEAARADQWQEWKLIQMQPPACFDSGGCLQVLNVLYWKPPPLLIEWGCALLRRNPSPDGTELLWQLAALAVAQRSEDPQFLIGDTKIGLGVFAGEIGNRADEIKHLEHARARFPNVSRFVLAEGIARDRDLADDAIRAYRALERDADVGGEALMRFGALQLRERKYPESLKSLERAETLTRDPYVVFLARYFKGQALERQDERKDAEAAYRGAVAAVPNAQSATVALAALVARDGRRTEAHRLVRDMLAADPAPRDPWRTYVHADDRFWPFLVARLRERLRPEQGAKAPGESAWRWDPTRSEK